MVGCGQRQEKVAETLGRDQSWLCLLAGERLDVKTENTQENSRSACTVFTRHEVPCPSPRALLLVASGTRDLLRTPEFAELGAGPTLVPSVFGFPVGSCLRLPGTSLGCCPRELGLHMAGTETGIEGPQPRLKKAGAGRHHERALWVWG